jgi:dihydroorotase
MSAGETFDLVVRGGTVVAPGKTSRADVGVRSGRIAMVGDLAAAPAKEVFDATHLHVLPGVMDTQVHFREPGLEHKEDLETGTRAALLGGVTAVFEMPNTRPPTTTAALLDDKVARMQGRAWVDFAFYAGATPQNAHELAELERRPGCAGVKMFMGSSTGDLLVAADDDVLRVLRSGTRRIAVHSEDEDRLRARKGVIPAGGGPRWHPIWRDVECALGATRRLIRLARQADRRVHVLHVTTREEIDFLRAHKDIASVETSPQHLTMRSPDCYERLGAYAQMNPPIRDVFHREGLWRGVGDGVVDVLGSDHAPHTRAEKDAAYPDTPSGMPGVQTLVGIMLDHVAAGRLTLERFSELMSAGPARIFGIAGKGAITAGFDADLTIVDLGARHSITNAEIASRCGWTPYDGLTVTGWPVAAILGGRVAMREGATIGTPAGRPVRFAAS